MKKEPIAILDDAGLAVTAGWITIYTIEEIHREYQQSIQEYLPEGVGLPAWSYADAPPEKELGFAILRNLAGTAWETVPDYRGKTVYSTETRQPETVTNLGPLVAGLTLLAPSTPHDNWDGEKWVTDATAQHAADVAAAQAELAARQRAATDRISTLQDAVDLEMATPEETALLLSCKKYRVLLSRVDVQLAPNIQWPLAPE